MPVSAFSAAVSLALGPEANDDGFEVDATMTLGLTSDGIDPVDEDVRLEVGTFATTIPAGSFTQTGQEEFSFEGVINGVVLSVVIRHGGEQVEVKATGQGADLTGSQLLDIGDDWGGAMLATGTASFQ